MGTRDGVVEGTKGDVPIGIRGWVFMGTRDGVVEGTKGDVPIGIRGWVFMGTRDGVVEGTKGDVPIDTIGGVTMDTRGVAEDMREAVVNGIEGGVSIDLVNETENGIEVDWDENISNSLNWLLELVFVSELSPLKGPTPLNSSLIKYPFDIEGLSPSDDVVLVVNPVKLAHSSSGQVGGAFDIGTVDDVINSGDVIDDVTDDVILLGSGIGWVELSPLIAE